MKQPMIQNGLCLKEITQISFLQLAQALLGVAQPYLFGGFSEKLISSAAYALDALKQSEDDVICRITDSDGNRDAVFLINENGSGYCFVAVSDDIIAQVGLSHLHHVTLERNYIEGCGKKSISTIRSLRSECDLNQ